jgi:hypothetical protein
LGGALEARGIDAGAGRLTAEAEGDVVVEDKVLVIKRIRVRYQLEGCPDDKREAAERAQLPCQPLPRPQEHRRQHRDLHSAQIQRLIHALDKEEAVLQEARPIRLGPGEGKTIQGPAGGPLTFKVRDDQTNGSLTAFENVIAPKDGPPLHTHANEDEA